MFHQFRRFGTKTGQELSNNDFWDIFQKAEMESFGEDNFFRAYYESMFGTFAIARECRLGFYHSRKDGLYQQLSLESLTELVESQYEQALKKAYQTICTINKASF